MNSGNFNRWIRIDRPAGRDPDYGSSSGWVTVVPGYWASIQSYAPGKLESVPNGVNLAARPARVRLPYHPQLQVDASMRIVLLDRDNREMRITTQPVEVGNMEAIEFMAEDYSTQGVSP